MCEVKDLLQSQPQSLATRLLGRRSVWTEISPLPVILSSLVTFQGQLLAVGGTSTEPNAEVRQYDDSTDSLKVIGHMKVKLRNCLAAVLPNNALIVCGGYTPNGLTATVLSIKQHTLKYYYHVQQQNNPQVLPFEIYYIWLHLW